MIIEIQGQIGEFQPEESNYVTNSESLNKALESVGPNEEITLKINSPGGSVFEGFNMYNTIKALPNNVTTEISNAMSIATLIALGADSVKMNEIGTFMIHRSHSMAMGNAEDMEKEIEVLKSIDEMMVSVYAAKTGKSFDEIKSLMDAETWYTANGTEGHEGALAAGFIDEIINPVDADIAAHYQKLNTNYMNKIQALFTKFKAEAMGDVVEETATEVVETPVVEATETETEPEASATETETEAAPQYVTMEQFQAFMKTMEELAAALQANQAEAAQAEVDKLKASLKRSSGQPPKPNASLDGDTATGWVDPYAKFRAEMKDIDTKTRAKDEN